jgi:hypothetical protein
VLNHEEKSRLNKLQEYPDSTDEILETWPTRAKLWSKWDQSLEGEWRVVCCRDQESPNTLTIDADSYSRESIQREVKQQQVHDMNTNSDGNSDSDGI